MSSTLKHRVRANAGERRKRLSVELSWRPVTAYVDWVTLGRSECLSGVEGRRRTMLKHSTRSRVARSRATPSYRVLVIRMTSSVPAGARQEVSASLDWSAVFGAPGRAWAVRSLGPLTLCLQPTGHARRTDADERRERRALQERNFTGALPVYSLLYNRRARPDRSDPAHKMLKVMPRGDRPKALG